LETGHIEEGAGPGEEAERSADPFNAPNGKRVAGKIALKITGCSRSEKKH
jgi:hypothetical protein